MRSVPVDERSEHTEGIGSGRHSGVRRGGRWISRPSLRPGPQWILLSSHCPRTAPRSRAFPAFMILSGLAVLLLALAPLRARADIRVEASLDPESVQVGEQATLTVSVDGATNLDQGPQFPSVDGLQIQDAGTSTSISIVNGHMSRSISYQFIVTPMRGGQFTIGPVEVRQGGTAYRSGAVTLSVGGGNGGYGGGGGGGGGGTAPAMPRGTRSQPSAPPSGGGWDPTLSGEASEGSNLMVHAEADRDHVYVGEQVTLRFQFYQREGVPLLQSPQYNPPSTEGFWREDLPPQRSYTRTIHGVSYQVTELVYALFPTQSGRLEIGPGSLDCVVRDSGRSRDPFSIFGGFFSEKTVRLQSRPVDLKVDPLPEPKPSDFSGGVGDYRLAASLEKPTASQNSPITLLLTVTGTGNVSTVSDPKLPDLPGVRSYPSGSEVKTDKQGDALSGTKTFKIVLVPENTGRLEIPPVGLSVFNPRERRYVHLESEALTLQVGPAVAGAGGEGGDVARVGQDLRTIRSNVRLSPVAAPLQRTSGFWILQALPVLLLGAALALRSRRERMEANWGLILSRGAGARLKREFEALSARSNASPAEGYARLDELLERYFTDRYRIAARGKTRDELGELLAREGIGEKVVAEVRAILDRCDFARFAPAAQTVEDFRATLERARRLPEVLERKRSAPRASAGATSALLLAALVLGGSLAAAGSARAARVSRDQAAAEFQQGNAAFQRGDYDAALRSYGAVFAGGWESPDLMLNLGDASYRAGRLGWAVYYFERGRRLDPADPDLRGNLDLARAATKDRAPGADDSRFLRWLAGLEDRVSLASSLRGLAWCWWLLVLWVCARLVLRPSSASGESRIARGIVTVSGLALGVLFVSWLGWTGMKLIQAANAPDAVVVADELPVRANPDPEATVEFTLHAGTAVKLGRSQGDFREVLFSDKLRGWGEAEKLALMDAIGAAALPPEDAPPTGTLGAAGNPGAGIRAEGTRSRS